MIFVTVGMNEAPFERLVRAVEPFATTNELVVQHGSSNYRPQGAVCVDFLPFDELVEYVRSSSLVVTHAGVGSVAIALANEKVPVVVPRRKQFGEAVDDHQVAFARRLAAGKLVTLVEDPKDLEQVRVSGAERRRGVQTHSALVDDLSAYLAAELEDPGAVAKPGLRLQSDASGGE